MKWNLPITCPIFFYHILPFLFDLLYFHDRQWIAESTKILLQSCQKWRLQHFKFLGLPKFFIYHYIRYLMTLNKVWFIAVEKEIVIGKRRLLDWIKSLKPLHFYTKSRCVCCSPFPQLIASTCLSCYLTQTTQRSVLGTSILAG